MAGLSRRALLTRVASARSPDDRVLEGAWLRVHRTAMACRIEVVLPGEDARFLAAARSALNEADRLEAMLTVFRDTSDLVRVNRGAARLPMTVPGELFRVLQMASEIHAATEGAFDITSTPLSRCWGFLRREGRLPLPAEIDAARACVDMTAIVLDEAAHSVSFRRAGVELNLGAIGKGFALDRMAAGLRASGVPTALLSAGRSSVLAVGAPPSPSASARQGWHVELQSLVRNEVLGTLMLRDAALGTSGAGEQYVVVNGVRYGHVIDPRTGWPAGGVRSASVVAASAAHADALSTAFLVGGVALARRYCEAHLNVLAIVTPDEGKPQVIGSHPGATVTIA